MRDAAAYVCWAFARAYTAQELAPSIPLLAPSLLVTACYDREVQAIYTTRCLQEWENVNEQAVPVKTCCEGLA